MVSEVKGQCRWIHTSIIVIGKLIWLCVSVGADCSSQNAKGNHGGKSHGFLLKNAGSDRRQKPLRNDKNPRCKNHTSHCSALIVSTTGLISFCLQDLQRRSHQISWLGVCWNQIRNNCSCTCAKEWDRSFMLNVPGVTRPKMTKNVFLLLFFIS